MSELKPCPFCGNEPVVEGNLVACNNLNCPTHDNYWTDPMIFTCDQWNTRPIEDALNKRIAELEAFIGKQIEAGEKMFTFVIDATDAYDEGMRIWDALVNDWKERER